uniref:Peptidoglycan-binding domain-containing protein n=1 Tax=Roseihalotalea indica TaxID=2867963 RepID=A0AA49JFJ2_9BACT|nr:peptidoglycan-binding domain-containing protein [Tunicatimonas sp. TK19036]
MIPFLQRGDRLPAVVSAQILLNQNFISGESIEADGIFGRQTEIAVRKFQQHRGLSSTGQIDARCWRKLLENNRNQWQTLEAIDVTEATDRAIYQPHQMQQITNQRLMIYNPGMSDGVRSVRQSLLGTGRTSKVMLLQFHGHGNQGTMGIGIGTGGDLEEGAYMSSRLGTEHSDSLSRFLAPLAPLFCRFGSVEMHGCHTGGGHRGRRLLQMLSDTWGVPVTAGLGNQYGHSETMFRFEGPTRTAFPGGGSLRSWARSLPEAAPVSNPSGL